MGRVVGQRQLKLLSSFGKVFFFAGVMLFAAPSFAKAAQEVRELLEWGDNDMALERAEEALDKTPDDAELQFYYALALARTGDGDDALEILEELAEEYPDRPEIYNNIAVLHAQEGDYEEARAALEKALSTHKSYQTAHKNLGDIYSAQAAEAYNKALARGEDRETPKPELNLLSSWGDDGSLKADESAKKGKVETKPLAKKDAVTEKKTIKEEVAADPDSNLAKLVAAAEAAGGSVKYQDEEGEPLKEKGIKEDDSKLPKPGPSEAEAKKLAEEQEAAKKAEEARKAEEAKKAEAAKLAEAKKAEAKKLEQAAKAKLAAEEAKKAEAKKAEQAAKAQEEKPAETAKEAEVNPAQAEEAAKAIESWAKAWREQKPDAYIGAYANFFRPENGATHDAWAKKRRDRVSAPNYIRINIQNLRIRLKGEGRAVATFKQDYQSDSYQDSVKKTLYLEKIEDKWLIVREVSE